MQANSFKALRLLHTSLVFGFAFFIIADFVMVSQKMMVSSFDKTTETIFQAVAAFLSIGCLLFGFQFFKKRLLVSRDMAEPAEKRFELYRAACIMWWALLEGPGLFATISYLLTGNLVFIILALFHLGMLVVFMPRKDNIVVLLNLTSEEVQRLEGVV